MIVGIDLGTTNSLIAVWEAGRARLIPNSLGEVLTPSCVSIDDDGSILIGHAARERLQTHPDRTAALFKRYMGSNHTVRLAGRDYRSEELSALVLRSLKEDAEAALGHTITEAIITVPAYFSDAQRKATRAAGLLAGLTVERLLNEPTAAALAYGIHQQQDESRFLVFDLGGGTFDVSVLDLFDGVMEVRASAGDNYLGGEDMVDALIELFFERSRIAASARNDAHFMQRLRARAEAAKRELAQQPQAVLRLEYQQQSYALDVSETVLEDICKPLLQRIRTPIERALRDARLRADELDRIVLAGGASRMPMIRRMVTRMFGRFPSCELNPDEVVALGAAVQAGLKMKDAALKEVVMTDVAPYSLGVEIARQQRTGTVSAGHFDPVIDRNSIVPVSKSKNYVPMHDDQRQVELRIYQGESRLTKDNVLLGTLSLALPPGRATEHSFDVRFTYDVSGLLQVDATLDKTGETRSLVIEGNPGLLSEQEIGERLKALSKLKIHPRDQLQNRTLLARAERWYQQLLGDQRAWLGAHISDFEERLASQDEREIRSGRKVLQEIIARLEGSEPVLAPDPAPGD